jgi:tetratricopeptide (TPR) repeat protein
MSHFLPACFLLLLALGPSIAVSDPEVSRSLVERYAEISLAFDDDSELEAPLHHLMRMAEQNRDAHPDNARAWIALARIRFGYANTQGPFYGMRLMKGSRDEMEKAIAMDPLAEDGFPQAFLGYLYAGVPSWPISFGNKRTSEEYFDEARSINSDGLELSYFMAIVSASDGEIELAMSHLTSAREMLDKRPASSARTRMYERSILRLVEDLNDRL